MNLSDLIGQDITLEPVGFSKRYWRWKDHDSFIVDDERGKWNWYSTGAFGDEVDWLILYRNLPKSEAYRQADSVDHSKIERQPLDATKVTYAQERLENTVALKYLDRRKLLSSTAKLFGVGYLSGKIVLPNYTGDRELVSVRYRCIYPSRDYNGEEIRYFSEPGSKPWYPYGLWVIPKSGKVLFIAEGEFKTMCVTQLGYPCIGTQASQFRPSWIEYLEGWDRVVFLRDTGEIPGIRTAVLIKRICPRVELIRMPRPYKAIDDYFVGEPVNCRTMLREIVDGFVTPENVTREILGSPRGT